MSTASITAAVLELRTQGYLSDTSLYHLSPEEVLKAHELANMETTA